MELMMDTIECSGNRLSMSLQEEQGLDNHRNTNKSCVNKREK